MRRIRVAHIITRLCKGGAQENTFHTVRLANRDRFDVDLISGPTSGVEGSIEDAIIAAGIPILREPDLVREPSLLRDARAYRALLRRFREARYDIVHTHTSKAGLLARLAARRAGVPLLVHTPHGNVFHGYFSRPVTRFFIALERYAAKRTNAIIELTAGGVEEHLEQGIGRREQFRVIFSGVDFAPFDAAPAQREAMRGALGYAPDEILIGGVGRLEPVKGFSYFVVAAGAIARELPQARFLLVGAGSQEQALRDAAAPLGSKFRFLGLRDDVPPIMAALDVLVVPSLNEGMGRVLLEAGAAQVPVVASRVGGIPDLLCDNETGLLVPPRDAAAIADAVLRLARDPERSEAMGRAARENAVPHYSLETMVRRIEALYEELLDGKHLDRRG